MPQPGAPLVAVADLVVDEHVEADVVERLGAQCLRPPQVGVGNRHGELDAVLAGGERVVALDHDDRALELGTSTARRCRWGWTAAGLSPVARATQVRRVTERGSSLSSTTLHREACPLDVGLGAAEPAVAHPHRSAWCGGSTGRQMPPGLWPDPSNAERPKAPVRSRAAPGADGVVVDLHGEQVLVAGRGAGG